MSYCIINTRITIYSYDCISFTDNNSSHSTLIIIVSTACKSPVSSTTRNINERCTKIQTGTKINTTYTSCRTSSTMSHRIIYTSVTTYIYQCVSFIDLLN